MNELKIFENREFGKMRTITVDNELWFVGKDVAEILGYKDTSDAIKKHVENEDKLTRRFADSGQNREMYIVNESGLYSLILSSKLPKAKEFKHWVTSEVLPSIRKTGGYIAGQEAMSDDELMAKALLVAQRQIEERNKLIETMRPKALFADAVATSKTSILVGELAKILKQNGVDMGQRRLFAWLRDNGFLMKRGSDYNMPTQRAMEMRLFEIKETTVNNPDGSVRVNKTTKVTGRGQNYFVNRFLGVSQE
ncbi:MAG: phage antirepressor KilAC domain-containing protein [Clostridia bacterium]|nr:phage antirepressor KilAC domain-containing protein [Clostridia bacterium]MBQ8836468.1 phage antirepressor KilAC domain-containing protein [Clostridia bacterium]